MTDREKVIKALENCNAPEKCRDCPWEPCEEFDCKHSDYPDGLIGQAIALLKAQEPRVMTDTELEAIRKAPLTLKPAVDAAPVVHGRWIERMYKSDWITTISYFCSECNGEHYWGRANYCPKCGAKMDGEWRAEDATDQR